jgi:hypothetical protein
LLTLVERFVSQPLFGLLSQLANPALQVGEHTPLEHDVEPLALEQMVPQAPQLVVLDRMSVSQPLFGLPSQSAHPAAQVGAHAPPVQLVVPWALVHWVPQAPQLLTLVERFTSQPLDWAFPSQLA